MVPWPSGKAKVCNTSIPGSIPGDASNNKAQSKRTGLYCWLRYARNEPGSARQRRSGSGSHSPPEDRQATRAARHLPGAGRANSRRRRDSGSYYQVKYALVCTRNSFLKEPPKDDFEEYARKVIDRAYFIILNKIDELDGTNERLLKYYRENIEKFTKLCYNINTAEKIE